MILRLSLQGNSSKPGCHSYDNKINAENYKEIALVLTDLADYGVPIEKAIKEFLLNKKTDWDSIIGE